MTALQQAREVRQVRGPEPLVPAPYLGDWRHLHQNGLKASLGHGAFRTYVPKSPNEGMPLYVPVD